jgi:hypothetical protein
MNKQDLDALANLYEEVYYPQDVEQLDELNATLQQVRDRRAREETQRNINATNQRAQLGVVKTNKGYIAKPGETSYDPEKGAEAIRLANRLNRETGLGKPQAPRPAGSPPQRPAAGSTPAIRPAAGSGSTPPSRPAASSTVLAKQKGVEGKLDKATGKFTAGAFSGAEKSRYASVAAQNAARNSTSSAPKPPTPAIGKLGNTSFERRTPTSAELRAAQDARSKGASPEKALQAAQKTNLPTQGPTPAIPDLKSVNADLAKANSPAVINRPAPAGTALAAQQSQQKKPPTPGTGAIKPMTQKSSYEWPSAKTIKDIADAYSSIYEAKKKVDQDKDGDNDFADVRVARMVASGVPKEVAIAKVRNKSYNEEVEIDEATAMAKKGYDETAIRSKIAKSTGGGKSADRATALENRPTYGDSAKQKARQNLARAQRGDFRKTTSSSPGLHGYAHKSDDPAVKAKQAARGAQRGALTPKEKKELNREAYEAYEFVASYLLENNFASRIEDANVIINNMSEGWFESIMEEKKPLPVKRMAKQARRIAFSQGVEDASDEGSSGYVSHSNPDRALKRMGKVGGPKVQHHIKKGYEMGTEHDPYYGRGKK